MPSVTTLASAADSDDSGAAAAVLIILLLWLGVGGGVGYLIGKSKGQAGAGFALGFFLGFIGWIIVAVMEPSQEERTRRQNEMTMSAVAVGQAMSGRQPHFADHCDTESRAHADAE